LASWMELVIGVGITTAGWIIVAYTSQPTSMEVMISFINKVSPGGPGWTKIINKAKADGLQLSEPSGPWKVPIGILCMIAGTVGIYAFLMGTGLFIYGRYLNAIILMGVTVVSIVVLKRFWSRLS